VYEARDQRLSSIVALKETFFSEEELRRAFKREASLLATLRHSALPKVIDHFDEGEGQFLVMEFIAGDDLGARLFTRGFAFPASEVVNWGVQALNALEYLHNHQPPIVHRDIKPQNMKLTERGELILLDFGLAKGAGSTSAISRSVQGYTLHYAPLEQIRGMGTDPRSDLYSLAATLYHLMTGVSPPDALARVAAMVASQPDPLTSADEVNPHISPEIARVLNRALSQDRDKRPASAAAMRAELTSAADSLSEARTVLISNNATAASPATTTGPTPQRRTLAYSSGETLVESPSNAERTSVASSPGSISRTSRIAIFAVTGTGFLIVAAIVAYLLLSGPSASAAMDGGVASSDRTNPTPLAAKTIVSGAGTGDRYFSVNARRGVIALDLRVLARGSTVIVELFNSKSEALRMDDGSPRLALVSNGHDEEAKARVIVDRDQPLLMKVGTSYPAELQVYRLGLEGELDLAGGMFGSPGKAPQPLLALLADRDNPAKLDSREVIGPGSKKDLYYSFTAGPGELKVMLDTVGSGGTTQVEVFDQDAKKMRFDAAEILSVAATGHDERDSANLLLDKQQPLLMRVTCNDPDGLRAFRLRIEGPAQNLAASASSSADPLRAALEKHFADRDNPVALTSNEISGRGSAKDLYYLFTAGPGKASVNVTISGGGSAINVELFDSAGARIRFDNQQQSFSTHPQGDTDSTAEGAFELDREQPVVMRIVHSSPESLRSFRVRLDGAVRLEGASPIGGKGVVPQPLSGAGPDENIVNEAPEGTTPPVGRNRARRSGQQEGAASQMGQDRARRTATRPIAPLRRRMLPPPHPRRKSDY